jgi:hypothetical protein
MDPTLISSVASEVLKNLIESGAKFFGTTLADKFQRSREESKKLDNYIYSLTNRVSYFVTYRPSPQHVDDVYVRPLILEAISKIVVLNFRHGTTRRVNRRAMGFDRATV